MMKISTTERPASGYWAQWRDKTPAWRLRDKLGLSARPLTWALAFILALASIGAWIGALQPSGLEAWSPDACAERATQFLTPEGRAPDADDLAQARRWTQREIELAPNRPASWTRLAYVEQAAAHGPSPAALEALRRAYELAPLDPDIALWRTSFTFSQWSRLPVDLRRRAMDEARAFSAVHENQAAMTRLAQTIPDAAGRFALQLILTAPAVS